jgi:hypothetical protein
MHPIIIIWKGTKQNERKTENRKMLKAPRQGNFFFFCRQERGKKLVRVVRKTRKRRENSARGESKRKQRKVLSIKFSPQKKVLSPGSFNSNITLSTPPASSTEFLSKKNTHPVLDML